MSELSDNLDFLGNRVSSQALAGSEEPAGPIAQQRGYQGEQRRLPRVLSRQQPLPLQPTFATYEAEVSVVCLSQFGK